MRGGGGEGERERGIGRGSEDKRRVAKRSEEKIKKEKIIEEKIRCGGFHHGDVKPELRSAHLRRTAQ